MDPIECSDMRMLHMILNLSYSHEWGRATAKIIGPCPWGPGEGSKSLNFNDKNNFDDFYTKNFVCVLTNKNIKYIEWVFWSDAWMMPQRWDLGAHGLNVFEHGHVAYQFDGNDA